jgi:hypothetical protein
MKTTVEISDALLAEVRRLAVEEGTTLRALIEAGLRQVLEGRQQAGTFHLVDASYGGNGLRPEFQHGGWPAIREAAYEDHGG